MPVDAANLVGQESFNATGDLDFREANKTITIQQKGCKNVWS